MQRLSAIGGSLLWFHNMPPSEVKEAYPRSYEISVRNSVLPRPHLGM